MSTSGEYCLKYLSDIIWHNLSNISELYKIAFNIVFPRDIGEIYRAIETRHHIVHRNGRKKDGTEIVITPENIIELNKKIIYLATNIVNAPLDCINCKHDPVKK